MAVLICTLQEFYDYIGPKIRNDVATITKQKKNELGLICEECKNKVNELDAAHKHGRSRKDIIKIVLDECERDGERYSIANLQKTIKTIKERHFPIEDNFRFLCSPCHRKYDAGEKNQRFDNMPKTKINTKYNVQDYAKPYQKEFELILSQNSDPKESLKELFKKYPDTEILSTELRRVYGNYYPDKTYTQTQIITNYLWHLARENFLKSSRRSYYILVDKTND